MLANHLILGELLQARIKNNLPQLRRVFGAAREDVDNLTQSCPFASVVYRGSNTVKADEHSLQLEQNWLVCIGVRNPAKQGIETSVKDNDAGKLISQVIELLHGWQPEGAGQGLTELLYNGEEQPFYDADLGVYAINFKCGFTSCEFNN